MLRERHRYQGDAGRADAAQLCATRCPRGDGPHPYPRRAAAIRELTADASDNEGGRTIWILTHRRLGDLRQMEELARLLGWPTTIKRLKFRPPNIPFLARFLLDEQHSDKIGPPWPDLVLCGEGLTSVIARGIGRKSRGQA